MKNYNRGFRKFAGKTDYKKRTFTPRREDDKFAKHKAICTACGKECEVPFKPTHGVPVYCNACFKASRGGDSKGFDRRAPTDRRPSYRADKPERYEDRRSNVSDTRENDKSMYQLMREVESLNYKLDKILKILAPSGKTDAPREKKTGYPKAKKEESKPEEESEV